MQTLLVDTLKAWREAERVLESLPPVDPNHEIVRGLVVELRTMYAKLSAATELPAEAVSRGRAQLDSAFALLTQVRGEGAS